MIKNVRIAGKTARATHDRNALPLAIVRVGCGGNLFGIELDVIAYKKIEVTVPVVIEKGTARAPTNLLLPETGFARNIRKSSISIVVEEDVMPPEGAKQVVPSIIVVVADTDAGLPACNSQP